MSSFRRPLVHALVVAAVAATAPAALLAQPAVQAEGGEHVVRRGDTLWHLAGRCLGDPFRWPELHQANTAVVANPHLIYPGERLQMPCGTPADATATAPAADAQVAVVGEVAVNGPGNGGTSTPGETAQPAVDADGRAERRQLDYMSAPYAAPAGSPRGAGRVHALSRTASRASQPRQRLLLGDEVRLELPEGAAPEPGARFLAVRRESGRESGRASGLARDAQIVRPTGVVELREFEGGLVRGLVVQVIDDLEEAQELIPIPVAGPEAGAGASGASARIVWVESGALLPSVQHWVVLAPTAGVELVEGDRLELLHPVAGETGNRVGDEVVATAHVVRVTPQGASAMLTSVLKPVVAVGTAARVVIAGN